MSTVVIPCAPPPPPPPPPPPASASAGRRRSWARLAREGGQATAEYALVLLGVAAIALLVTAWAARSGKIGRLFDAVMDHLISQVG